MFTGICIPEYIPIHRYTRMYILGHRYIKTCVPEHIDDGGYISQDIYHRIYICIPGYIFYIQRGSVQIKILWTPSVRDKSIYQSAKGYSYSNLAPDGTVSPKFRILLVY